MKKIISITAPLYGVVALNAQNVNPLPLELTSNYNGFVPASLISDGSARLTFQQPDNILVYNSDFELEATVAPMMPGKDDGRNASVILNMPNVNLNLEEWGIEANVTLEEAKSTCKIIVE